MKERKSKRKLVLEKERKKTREEKGKITIFWNDSESKYFLKVPSLHHAKLASTVKLIFIPASRQMIPLAVFLLASDIPNEHSNGLNIGHLFPIRSTKNRDS